MKRPLIVFTSILCLALLLDFSQIVSKDAKVYYWCGAFAAALLAACAAGAQTGSRPRSGSGEFLCDSCKYCDPRYCSRPERPNATQCSDYRKQG